MFYQEQARLFLLGVVIVLAEAFVVNQVLGLVTKSVGLQLCDSFCSARLAHARAPLLR